MLSDENRVAAVPKVPRLINMIEAKLVLWIAEEVRKDVSYKMDQPVLAICCLGKAKRAKQESGGNGR